MPLYTFQNVDTGEYFESLIPYDEKVKFLEENPNIISVPVAPKIISGSSTSSTNQIDGGFRDVLNRIGNANPHSPLAERYGSKGIRETKNRKIVQRQKERQARDAKALAALNKSTS